ncbi:MAG: branched-chain amino acid ABC transporter permease [Alphaproteobacteria bacterium]|uniref:Branched-chain amino acid ABC transporter permease n=1 Tax=Candidatus Nitrobium versatile TaxID=2884831 RepID=A0A953LZ93_9BACT|nr:branched-chain amino acid ABC transporter permease [Candidatus Nitrobium versatile]
MRPGDRDAELHHLSGAAKIRRLFQQVPLFRYLVIGTWAGLLFLPFKSARASLLLFVAVAAGQILLHGVRATGRGEAWKKSDFRALLHRGVRSASPYARSSVLPVLLAVSLVIPFMVKDYYLDVLIMSGIYILLALGLNVIVGFTGLLNLGFAAFYAIGAYAYALLNTRMGIGFWPSLPLAALAASLAGLLLAVPALRLRGDYLAIVTLGFGEILRLVLNNWDSLTNGPNGVSGIAPPSLAGFPLGALQHYYYLVLVFVLLAIVLIRRVENSRIGRAWIAIRENEIAAASMGINTTRYKLLAFAVGTFWAGIAGTLFAAKMRFISPESFTFMESILILSMVILGGLGTLYGAVVGAFLLVILPELLRELQLYRMLILGVGLVLLMVFRPQGLLGKARGK